MAFNPASLNSGKAEKVANEQVLAARLFEGAAGGAVMLGTAPQCAEFQAFFDWPDAMIEVSPQATDIAAIIDDLDAQPERLARIRLTNAAQCLLNHDWAHRWEQVLSTMGLQPRQQLTNRKAQLRAIASAATVAPSHGSGQLTPAEMGRQPKSSIGSRIDVQPANSGYLR